MVPFLIVVFIIFILILVLRRFGKPSYYQSAEEKGEMGEEIVYNELLKCVKPNDRLLNNYMFQGETISVQVDHIVINGNGVFVIETKNYSGKIYGSNSSENWTQIIRTKRRYYRRNHSHTKTYIDKYAIRNPIKQNAGHIYQLSKILPEGIKFHNIVVLVQGNIADVSAENVISPNGLNFVLNPKKGNRVLNSSQINEIYEILCSKSIGDKVSNKQHVREIQEMLYDVNNYICPRCKGSLVLRNGKYGQFYGCSNYPKCKFTKQL